MFRNPEANGSLAASMAVACVLSLAPAAAAYGGVSSSPLPHGPACCASAETPVGRGDASLLLAQSAEQPVAEPDMQAPPTTGSSTTGSSTTGSSGDAEAGPAEAAAGNGDSFRGNPQPAGPSLTVDEERELISRGWD